MMVIHITDLPLSIEDTKMNQVVIEGKNMRCFTRQDLLYKLHDIAKEFILNSQNGPNLPELFMIEVTGLDTVTCTMNHIFSIQIDKKTSPISCLAVLNELRAVYDEVRDEFAQARLNKSYSQLSSTQQELIFNHCCPLKVR